MDSGTRSEDRIHDQEVVLKVNWVISSSSMRAGE